MLKSICKHWLSHIATISVAVLAVMNTSAQSPCDLPLTKTTKADASLTDKFSHRPNFFQWIGDENFDVNSLNFPSDYVESPYFQLSNSVVNSMVQYKDYHVEDGWELVTESFGFTYSAVGVRTNGNHQVNPYFVLYNKYRGILRVFVCIGENDNNFTAATMELTYDAAPNAIRTSNIHEATEVYPNIATDLSLVNSGDEIRAFSTYSNTTGDWIWSDFAIMYDPCACLNKALYVIRTYLVYEADIELSTEGTLIQQFPNGPATVKSDANAISLSSVVEAGDKAYQTFKSLNDFKNKEQAAIDKAVAEAKVSQARGDKAKSELTFLQRAIHGSDLLQAGLKAAPFLGAAFTLIDFFTSSSKKQDPPTPMIFEQQASSNGTLTATSLYESIYFGGPGGDHTGFPALQVPYYNYPMGITTLVRTPSYDYWFQDAPVPNNLWGYTAGFDPEDCEYLSMWDHYRIRVPDELVYAINSHAGLEYSDDEDIDIMASIVAEWPEDNGYPTVEPRDPSQQSFTIQDHKRRLSTRFVSIACLSDVFLEGRVMRRKVLKRNACDNGYWNCGGRASCTDPLDCGCVPELLEPRVYLRVLSNIKRSDGNGYVLHLATYPLVKGDEKSSASFWISGDWHNAPLYHWFSQPISANTEKRVWSTIEINSGFEQNNGATLLCTAGELITVFPGVTLKSEATLRIDQPTDCNAVTMPITVNSLTSFCESNAVGDYRPDDRDMSKIAGRTPIPVSLDTKHSIFVLDNAIDESAKGNIRISSTLGGMCTIRVFEVSSGRTLSGFSHRIEQGLNIVRMPEHIASGAFGVELSLGDMVVRKLLVCY